MKVFEEDFQRERSDRERMNEEKEELKQQLEKLQKQLTVSSHQVRKAPFTPHGLAPLPFIPGTISTRLWHQQGKGSGPTGDDCHNTLAPVAPQSQLPLY